MSKPSNEQMDTLRSQMAQMRPDQWLAMMNWILLPLACEQRFFVALICDEAYRRQMRYTESRMKQIIDESTKTPTSVDHLLSVMADLKLKLTPEGCRA